MTRSPDFEDPKLDRLLSGNASGAPDPGTEDVARFVGEIRATHLHPPDRALETQHVAAMVTASRLVAAGGGDQREGRAAAHGSPDKTSRTRNWRSTMFRTRFAGATVRLLAAALVTFLAVAGLAVAGVTLPDPARGVANSLGLPNQESKPDDSPASRVLGEQPPPSNPGCEFGQAVAERASDGKVAADDPCDKGKNRSDEDDERSDFGQETAARAKSQGPSRSDHGNSTPGRPGNSGTGGASPNTPSGPPAGVPAGPPGGAPPGRP